MRLNSIRAHDALSDPSCSLPGAETLFSEGMHNYKAYGLLFSSEVPIRHFPEVNSLDKPDVRIARGEIFGPGYKPPATMQIEASSERLLLRGARSATFLVTGGDSIIIETLPEGDPLTIMQILLGWALGGLFHQRAMLPLHGSTVCFGDECYVFCAASGVGKSTLAAEFLNRGFSFLDDNIALAEMENGIPSILPGSPELRLWEGGMKLCQFEHRVTGRIRQDMDKMSLIAAGRFRNKRARIRKIFIMKRTEGDAFALETLAGVAKFNALLANIFFLDYIKVCGVSATQFSLLRNLADAVPIAEILLPDPLPSPADICEGIIRAEGMQGRNHGP